MKNLIIIPAIMLLLSGCAAALPPICLNHGGRDYPRIEAKYVLCKDGCILSGDVLVIPGRSK